MVTLWLYHPPKNPTTTKKSFPPVEELKRTKISTILDSKNILTWKLFCRCVLWSIVFLAPSHLTADLPTFHRVFLLLLWTIIVTEIENITKTLWSSLILRKRFILQGLLRIYLSRLFRHYEIYFSSHFSGFLFGFSNNIHSVYSARKWLIRPGWPGGNQEENFNLQCDTHRLHQSADVMLHATINGRLSSPTLEHMLSVNHFDSSGCRKLRHNTKNLPAIGD